MTTQTINVPCQINTAAGNGLWVQQVSQALTAIGLPLNGTVTGQINSSGAAIALPTFTAGTQLKQIGFETRSISGTGLRTVNINVYYGLYRFGASDTNYWPMILITFGDTVTTAGQLGAPMSEAGVSANGSSGIGFFAPGFSPPATSIAWNLCSDGVGHITLCVDPTNQRGGPAAGSMAFGYWERTRNYTTGAYDSAAYEWGMTGSSVALLQWATNGNGNTPTLNINAVNNMMIYGAGTAQTNAYGFTAAMPGLVDTLFASSSTASPALFPCARSIGAGGLKAPQLNALIGYTTDAAGGTMVTGVMYGANHNYIATGTTVNTLNGANEQFLLLFE